MCRVLALLALGACSFQGPALGADAHVGGGHDGAIDAATIADDGAADGSADATVLPLTCMQKWQQHLVVLGDPVPLTTINSPDMDRDVWVSLDEMTLYFAHFEVTDADVFVSTFDTGNQQWRTPVTTSLKALDVNESKLSMTSGTFAVASIPSATGDYDLEVYTRTSTTSFTHTSTVGVAMGPANDYDPYITPDGLRLYWAPDGPASAPQQIALATRADASSVFGNVQMLTELGTGVSDPAPSFDETVLLYSAPDQGGAIHYATRPSVNGPFTAVGPVPTINTAANEADPHLSKDGCHLYFARFSATTDWDLYMSTVE